MTIDNLTVDDVIKMDEAIDKAGNELAIAPEDGKMFSIFAARVMYRARLACCCDFHYQIWVDTSSINAIETFRKVSSDNYSHKEQAN